MVKGIVGAILAPFAIEFLQQVVYQTSNLQEPKQLYTI
jgi:hypothetical protein